MRNAGCHETHCRRVCRNDTRRTGMTRYDREVEKKMGSLPLSRGRCQSLCATNCKRGCAAAGAGTESWRIWPNVCSQPAPTGESASSHTMQLDDLKLTRLYRNGPVPGDTLWESGERWAEFAKGYGGEGEIRTPDSLSTMPDFESGAFNRALPPLRMRLRQSWEDQRHQAMGRTVVQFLV